MTAGPIFKLSLRISGLAQSHKVTKKKSPVLPFVPSCLRAQKTSVFRFKERAA